MNLITGIKIYSSEYGKSVLPNSKIYFKRNVPPPPLTHVRNRVKAALRQNVQRGIVQIVRPPRNPDLTDFYFLRKKKVRHPNHIRERENMSRHWSCYAGNGYARMERRRM
jgi:hypothetical protein